MSRLGVGTSACSFSIGASASKGPLYAGLDVKSRLARGGEVLPTSCNGVYGGVLASTTSLRKVGCMSLSQGDLFAADCALTGPLELSVSAPGQLPQQHQLTQPWVVVGRQAGLTL